MGTHAGSEGKVFIGENQVAEVKSWSMEVTSDTVDASVKYSNKNRLQYHATTKERGLFFTWREIHNFHRSRLHRKS